MPSEIAAALLRVPYAPPLPPARIRELRRQLDLTQDDAAELVGVARNTWARWERGEMDPHPLMLAHLARAPGQLRGMRMAQDRAEVDAGVTARPMEREERPTVFDRPTPAPKRSMSAQDRALLDAAAAKRQRRALKRAGSNGAP